VEVDRTAVGSAHSAAASFDPTKTIRLPRITTACASGVQPAGPYGALAAGVPSAAGSPHANV